MILKKIAVDIVFTRVAVVACGEYNFFNEMHREIL